MSNPDPLIQQNAYKAQKLSQVVDRAAAEIEEIHKFATSLTAIAASANPENLEALNDKLEEIENNFDSKIETVKDNLTGLQEGAGQLDELVSEIINQVKSQLDELKNKVEQELTEIEGQAETTTNNLAELASQFQEMETEIDSQIETAKTSISEFREFVEDVKENLTERQTNLLEQFEAFEEKVKQKIETLMGDFDNLIEQGKNQLTELENSLDSISEDAVTNLNKKFIEEALGELTNSAGDLGKAISVVSEIGENSQELMDGKIGEIMDKVSEVTNLIEEIKPVLDLVKSML